MKILEGLTDLQTRIELSMHILELSLEQDEVTHVHESLWAKIHEISKGAISLFGNCQWPDEVICRSSLVDILNKVLLKCGTRIYLVPLQGLLLSIHIH